MAIIIPANTLASGGYAVDNSCRWNRADSPYMHQTFSGAGNRDKWTFSCWVKKCSNGVEQRLLTTSDNSSYDDNIRFNSDDTFNIICNGATVLKTNRLFRDNSAFYHICVIWDSGNGTAGNRCLLYVNGIRETSFGTESYPSADVDSHINNNTPHYIGVTNATADSHHLHGYLAEVVFQNDNADSPVDKFGEFDEDSGIWKPIKVSGLTFGTNGTYLDFKDSANLGNDASGGTDWTEVNFAATDQATDTPTNSFCTMNPLSGLATSSQSFSEGNLIVTNSAGGMRQYNSSFASASGKWYAEVKVTSVGGDAPGVGIIDPSKFDYDSHIAASNSGYCYLYGGNKQYNGSGASYGDSWTTGDIIGIAMDLTNSKLYFSKNGTWQDSGDPTSGATGTGSAYNIVSGVFYTFGGSSNDTGTDPVYSWNFGGCPSFAISSGNADGDGYGNFEYAVPSGYFALCTKNLAEYG